MLRGTRCDVCFLVFSDVEHTANRVIPGLTKCWLNCALAVELFEVEARAWLPSQVKSRGREETMERRRVSQRAALKRPASQDKVKTLVFIPIKAKTETIQTFKNINMPSWGPNSSRMQKIIGSNWLTIVIQISKNDGVKCRKKDYMQRLTKPRRVGQQVGRKCRMNKKQFAFVNAMFEFLRFSIISKPSCLIGNH